MPSVKNCADLFGPTASQKSKLTMEVVFVASSSFSCPCSLKKALASSRDLILDSTGYSVISAFLGRGVALSLSFPTTGDVSGLFTGFRLPSCDVTFIGRVVCV